MLFFFFDWLQLFHNSTSSDIMPGKQSCRFVMQSVFSDCKKLSNLPNRTGLIFLQESWEVLFFVFPKKQKVASTHFQKHCLFVVVFFLVRNSSLADYQAVAQTATPRPTCVFWPKYIGRFFLFFFAVWVKIVSLVCCLQLWRYCALEAPVLCKSVSAESRKWPAPLVRGNIVRGLTPSNAINAM